MSQPVQLTPPTVEDFVPRISKSLKAFAAISATRGCPEYEHRYDQWSRLFYKSLDDLEQTLLRFQESVDPCDPAGTHAHVFASILGRAVEALFAPPRSTNPKIVEFVRRSGEQCTNHAVAISGSKTARDLWSRTSALLDIIGAKWGKLEESANILKERMSEVIGHAVEAGFAPGTKVVVDLGRKGKSAGVVVPLQGKQEAPAAWCSVRLRNGQVENFPITYLSEAAMQVTARAEITPWDHCRITKDHEEREVRKGTITFPEGDEVPFTIYAQATGYIIKVVFSGTISYIGASGSEVEYVDNPKRARVFRNPKAGYDALVFLLGHAGKFPTTASVVTAADPISDRVAGQIIGDLKRIRSTVASWKGKMDPQSYADFVAYQKAVGNFIAKTYIPRMSDASKAKAKAL